MSGFDFDSAALPVAEPLQNSFAENQIEQELKGLFFDLFGTVSSQTFDASVMGAAHLGSFELVRQMVNHDGLILMPGDREEAATRYLYRAWRSGDIQKRGLHFLRTYLQMLFPNACEVNQLWHSEEYPYPSALFSEQPVAAWWLHQVGEPGLKLDGSWGLGRRIEGVEESRKYRRAGMSGMWLTSRVEISLDLGIEVQSVSRLLQIIRSVIPARLVPAFVFWLNTVIDVRARTSFSLHMDKQVAQRYPWPGRVVSAQADAVWRLGRDGETVRLPLPMGSFRVGERRGALTAWRLKNERIAGSLELQSETAIDFWKLETLPSDPVIQFELTPVPIQLYRRARRLDGSWTLGGALKIGRFKLDGRPLRVRKMAHSRRLGSFKLHNEQSAVAVPPRPARLTLSGAWKLGSRLHPDFDIQIIKEPIAHG